MLKSRASIRTALLGSILVALLAQGLAQAAEKQTDKPLYDRLGGVYPIAAVVDEFIDLLLVNDVLNANPAIKAAKVRVPAAGLKYHLTAMVCRETGGPCEYTGRSMKESHGHLKINEKEWQATMADLRRVMNNYEVPAKEQDELMAIVEGMKKEIAVTE
ncbi:group I truncated hemoglobin [Candidatus Thiosymbion oneisti]|uniref:group I truncated hemoglobin n=1 Tax=Candidatus Thiosymbion oneisti TaxID=589554 RepID=UPI000B0AAD92|nr:group 1 truncated hemoglobin [Candidatus Thiosymbion oneisti]